MIIKDKKLTHDEAASLISPMSMDLQDYYKSLYAEVLEIIDNKKKQSLEKMIEDINNLFKE